MSEFVFEKIETLKSLELLNEGFYLWLWYADKIPPHIGCSINGKYYSLKVNGKDENIEVKKVQSIIDKKKIPTVFVKVLIDIAEGSVKNNYSEFRKAESLKITCLKPITSILDCRTAIQQLSDLLVYLKNNKLIESVFGLNLADNYKGIPHYTVQDIENRLRKLENVKIQKHIPSVR